MLFTTSFAGFQSQSSSSSGGGAAYSSNVYVTYVNGNLNNFSTGGGNLQTSVSNGIVSVNSPTYGSINVLANHDFAVVNEGGRLVEKPLSDADRALIKQKQAAFQASFKPMVFQPFAPMKPLSMGFSPMQPMSMSMPGMSMSMGR